MPTSPAARSILWRRLDRPGHEAAWLTRTGSGWRLAGTAVFPQDGQPCALQYTVDTDAAWRTVAGTVAGHLGERELRLELRVDAERRWFVNGVEQKAVAGCEDLDYGFSPATNLLPIRRLQLAVGASAGVRAGWVRFPALTLEPLEQMYRRTGPSTYLYESGGAAFRAELTVDEHGLVTRYAGFFEAEPL
jgi:hypothetical protein